MLSPAENLHGRRLHLALNGAFFHHLPIQIVDRGYNRFKAKGCARYELRCRMIRMLTVSKTKHHLHHIEP
jgi:hypothetical protein